MKINLKLLGEKNPNVARDYNHLGLAWCDLGDFEKGIEFFKKVLPILTNAFGRIHPDIAITLNNFGLAYSQLGDTEKAIECYRKAFMILMTFYEPVHPQIQRVLSNLLNLVAPPELLKKYEQNPNDPEIIENIHKFLK